MNTKYLLVLLLVINIGTLFYGSQVCNGFDSNSMSTQIVDWFYDYSFLKTGYSQCNANLAAGISSANASALLPTNNVVSLSTSVNGSNSTYGSAILTATTPSGGVVGSFVSGGVAFLDLIKLTIGIPALLIGLPVPFILSALNVSPIIAWFIVPIAQLLLTLGAIEFLRGGSL